MTTDCVSRNEVGRIMRTRCLYLHSSFSSDGACYADIPSRLLGQLKTNDKTGMTPEVCQTICFEKNNFQYAGVQFSIECFCGNYAPPSSKLLPKSECNRPCPGDSSKKCGGVWKMNVYKRKFRAVTAPGESQ